MLSFTLDTNCVIAVEEARRGAESIRRLAEAHACCKANVAIVVIMASEKQRHGGWLEDLRNFQERLAQVGLAHLGLCNPMAYWDICFWDHSLWLGDEEHALEQSIHNILFTNIEVSLTEFCKARNIPSSPVVWDDVTHIWRNAKCDVQAIWSHINAGRDVFVTSDGNFHQAAKKEALLHLGARRIERPDEASRLL